MKSLVNRLSRPESGLNLTHFLRLVHHRDPVQGHPGRLPLGHEIDETLAHGRAVLEPLLEGHGEAHGGLRAVGVGCQVDVQREFLDFTTALKSFWLM